MSEHLPPLGTTGLLRWTWRQLTSMRTALVLLFLLAVASIPGSVLPQRSSDPLAVNAWIARNPAAAPWVDRLGLFDVFGSAWFAAVYLLLVISLIGCVIPRLRQLWRAWRTPPPAAPRHLDRMASVRTTTTTDAADGVLQHVADHLRGRRWRVRTGSDDDGGWVAAEKGLLKEVGNLGFHVALVLVLVAVAIGALLGWKGNVIVRVGQGFSDTVTQYDSWSGGRLVRATELPPFTFTLDSFEVEFERSDSQRGAPRAFDAQVSYRVTPDAPVRRGTIEVNQPLRVGEATVYLVGHGYAPHLVVTDSTGAVVFDDTAVFLPQDGNFTSTGVVKAPDATPSMGFEGVFLPTVELGADGSARSVFPAPDDPAVVLVGWQGDLGLDSGVPQSVYTLRTEGMTRIGVAGLRPGQTWTLPGGRGTVAFTGVDRWASFHIAHDPGKGWALLAALLVIAGMILTVTVQRRRVWVRATTQADELTLVAVAGLTKSAGLDDDPAGALVDDLRDLIVLLTDKERP